MLFPEIPKALLVGFLAAAPIGPVLILVIQKTLCHSRRGGLMAGLGSAVIDTTYATIGLFALGLVKGFIKSNEAALMIAGGCVVILVGFLMLRKKNASSSGDVRDKGISCISYTFQAMLCALSNPGAVFFMMALLALTGLDAASLTLPFWTVLLCVFVGELVWWTIVTFALTRLVHFSDEMLVKVNKIFSMALMVLGAVVLVRGFLLIL